jgi:hypothetical protein
MRRMFVGLACVTAALSVGAATVAAKTPAKPKEPLALTMNPGCWASVVNFKLGCSSSDGKLGVVPFNPLTFDVSVIYEGDENPVAVRYIDLFDVTQPCFGTNSGYWRSTAGPDSQPILSTWYSKTLGGTGDARVFPNAKGKFSWHGKLEGVVDLSKFGGQEPPATISGQILSNTKAKVTVWVHGGSCRKTTAMLKWVPQR